MNRVFHVTLEKEEYLEFLNYQLVHSGKMKGSRWFLLTSVPAVLVTGMLLVNTILEEGKLVFFTSMLILAVFWIMYGAGTVWKNYIRRKVERVYWPKLNIKEFREVRYEFEKDGIDYREAGKKIHVPYEEIQVMVPLQKEFAFYHTKGVILLPYRYFEGEADMKEFLKEYEQSRGRTAGK